MLKNGNIDQSDSVEIGNIDKSLFRLLSFQ